MPKFLTEDEVRDSCKLSLGFDKPEPSVKQGTGQLTTFNKLGIKGDNNKPDGWYLPNNKNDVAIEDAGTSHGVAFRTGQKAVHRHQ